MRPDSRLTAAIVCAALVALVWFVFGQTAHYPFINYDDPEYTYENAVVMRGVTGQGIVWAFTHAHSGNWHPLTSISHMVDCQFFHLDAGPPHVVNVVLHALTAILLFLFLRAATQNIWPSAFVAAVFAIHPLRVESVAWISERKDVLSGLFFLLTLWAYVCYTRRRSIARYAVVSILFAAGLMSKAMLVTTPLVLLLLDYWPLQRFVNGRALRQLFWEKVPLFVLSILASIATVLAQKQAIGSFEQLPLSWRITNAITSYVVYLRQTLWPVDLAVFYPHHENRLPVWEVLGAAALILVLSLAAILLRRSRPYLITGWFWFLGMLVPVIGLVQVGLQGHADRYTYLPQIGLLIAATWLVCDLAGGIRYRVPTLATAAVLIIAALTATARTQVEYWRDGETLWQHAIAVAPGNYVAHQNLADLLMRKGRVADSIEQSEEAVRIYPRDADAQNNLGLAYLQLGDQRKGAFHLNEAIKDDPNNLNTRVNLAWLLATSDKDDLRNGARAIELVEDVARGPGHDNAIVLRTLAAAYAEVGRYADALAAADRALEFAKRDNNPGLTADLERAIDSYKMQQPLRSR